MKHSGVKSYNNHKWLFRQRGLHQQELHLLSPLLITRTRTSSIIHLQYATERRDPGGRQAVCIHSLTASIVSPDTLMTYQCTFEQWVLPSCHPNISITSSPITFFTYSPWSKQSHLPVVTLTWLFFSKPMDPLCLIPNWAKTSIYRDMSQADHHLTGTDSLSLNMCWMFH